ncbi:MAG: hypothetical protein RI601_12795, partial [Desulfurivibrionaceae bacterium]|nr:hypothetical protein [Desulfurivibrionaceae bacterium]
PHIVEQITKVCNHDGPGPWLKFDLAYQIIMARLQYLRVPDALPDHFDIAGLAAYWKQHYNTPAGRGTVDEFIKNYQLTR